MADRLYASTRKGVLVYKKSGGAWVHDATYFLGSPASMTLAAADNKRIFAALNLGHFGVKLHRSDDGGKTWTELPPPAFPKSESTDATTGEGDKKAPAVSQIWAMEWAKPGNVEEIWCGTAPGALFHSGDGGNSWKLIESLWNMPERERWFGGGADVPIIHSISVDPRNTDRIAAGVSCGGVWLTEDNGKTWSVAAHGMRAEYMPPDQDGDPVIQDPHRTVQCPSAPNVWWTQHHNGIFRSTDDLKSWHEIKTAPVSKFGFAVAVHPKNPDVAWFVPAVKDEARYPKDGNLVVQRTKDGGKTFEVITKGLPQGNAFDLIYRHGLDVDATGQDLAMASTTGSLWTSGDGGDSWTLVSAHLPPTYAVRLG